MSAGKDSGTPEKPKLAVYWGASCGGCEISLLNLHERLLDVAAAFDFIFCPCLLDMKKKDVEAMPDGSIAVTLFNGAIRTSENEEMARLMRRKSKILIAFGGCAAGGAIPALSNLHSRADHFSTIYLDNPTLDNPELIIPLAETSCPEGTLKLPVFYDNVRSLRRTVPVDFVIPGCPPESHQLWNALQALLSGEQLPSPEGVLGAGISTVCEECSRTREDKRLTRLYRTWELSPDPEQCLLDQGLVCMGIATRNGCGALCPQANAPCSGCYGAPDGTSDQGAKMVAALGSVLDLKLLKGKSEAEIDAEIDRFFGAIPDYAGTFFKYSLEDSLLRDLIRRSDDTDQH